jgi:hypothetical protein
MAGLKTHNQYYCIALFVEIKIQDNKQGQVLVSQTERCWYESTGGTEAKAAVP